MHTSDPAASEDRIIDSGYTIVFNDCCQYDVYVAII